jgi:hypothetical protein
MRHILVTADSIVDPPKFRDFDVPPDIGHKGWRWLPCPMAARPQGEVVEGPFYTLNKDDVTESFTTRSLTAAELDARKESRLDAEDRLQFDIHFDLENRVRVLEGKAAITRAQYRAALKARL